MTEPTATGDAGARASTDPDAHGGPTLSSMAGSAAADERAPREPPAGLGETRDESREPVDSVGATPGPASRALRTVRDHPGVTAGVLIGLAAVATIVVLMLRRR